MTQTVFKTLAVAAGIALAGCGGGGSSTGAGAANPIVQPPVATGNLPLSEAVAGAAAWVDPASHRTLYFLDVDTPTGGTCTGQCLSIWPVFMPSAGAQSAGNMTIVTRSDGAGQQWAYQLHPLYTFTGDTGPDQANGDNFPDFGGHWHVARPGQSVSGGGDSATPPPCSGSVYC